jgi:hypothetical protein
LWTSIIGAATVVLAAVVSGGLNLLTDRTAQLRDDISKIGARTAVLEGRLEINTIDQRLQKLEKAIEKLSESTK